MSDRRRVWNGPVSVAMNSFDSENIGRDMWRIISSNTRSLVSK